MNATPNRTERRRSPQRVEPIRFASIKDQCKWVRPNSFAASYCAAMGWELLISEPDGMLYRAPEGFEVHATERLPA